MLKKFLQMLEKAKNMIRQKKYWLNFKSAFLSIVSNMFTELYN